MQHQLDASLLAESHLSLLHEANSDTFEIAVCRKFFYKLEDFFSTRHVPRENCRTENCFLVATESQNRPADLIEASLLLKLCVACKCL